MIIQKVLKGISGLTEMEANNMIDQGIICGWWRTVGRISAGEAIQHLTAVNAELHLNHYHKPVPSGNALASLGAARFGDVSPFISTTAGAIQQDHLHKKNICFDPFLTALRFATGNFRYRGYVFYAYLFTIGKIAIEMEQFSEEVRELHIYKDYLPYHRQGEVMAKIIIPTVQIEKAVGYDGPTAKRDIIKGRIPTPLNTIINSNYQQPEKLSNIREVLS